jgi:hypothetical protein
MPQDKKISQLDPSIKSELQDGSKLVITVDGESKSIDLQLLADFYNFVAQDGNITVKGDLNVLGEILGQATTLHLKSMRLSSSGGEAFLIDDANNKKFILPTIEVPDATDGKGIKNKTLTYFSKTDPNGQQQPVQDGSVIPATLDPISGYYYIVVQEPSIPFTTLTNNWYFRSATGFSNMHLKGYNFFTSDPNETAEPVWQSHTDKDINNDTTFSAAATTTSDIQFPLTGIGFKNTQGSNYSYIAKSKTYFELEAADI